MNEPMRNMRRARASHMIVALLLMIASACGQVPVATQSADPTAVALQATPPPTPVVATTIAAPSPTPAPTSTPTPKPVPRGKVEPNLVVDVYDAANAWPGSTLFAYQAEGDPRILEVNGFGEVLWQYVLPPDLRPFTRPGFDAELLPNDNILIVLPRNGVYEIDRSGKVVWSFRTAKISHDADRLPNGNTIFVFGNNDTKDDPQVVEVDARGQLVWSWYARDHFDRMPYRDVAREGWTHTNAVQRLANGNTQISLRNFHLVVEVDVRGAVVRTIGEGILDDPHDPVLLPTGNLLVATHNSLRRGTPQRAVELDGASGQITWEYKMPAGTYPVRDANRLPNGNTLVTGSTVIVEVTPQGKVVWQLRLRRAPALLESARFGFYKAERVAISP